MAALTYYGEYDSPAGVLGLTSDGEYLTGLTFKRDGSSPVTEGPVPAVLEQTRRWLDAYFAGKLPPELPALQTEGTPFQKLIWNLLQDIPCGGTLTYGELAARAAAILGRDRMSPQAVGQAVGANPIAILIPCHRCVGAGGKLTGYAWGISRKQWLLWHEQNRMEDNT